MKYKLDIFDFDGTLAESFPFFLATVNELACVHKFNRIDSAELDTLRRYGARAAGSRGSSAVDRAARRTKLQPNHGREDRPDSAVCGRGRHAAQSNAYENIRHVLTPEIADLMVRPQCSTSLFGKSTRVRNILRHTGVLPNEAIFIGDEIRDMDAAHDAGVHFGAVTWGYTSADARVERSPAEVFASVDEIVAKITRPAS